MSTTTEVETAGQVATQENDATAVPVKHEEGESAGHESEAPSKKRTAEDNLDADAAKKVKTELAVVQADDVAPEKPLVVASPPYHVSYEHLCPEVVKYLTTGRWWQSQGCPLVPFVFDYAGYNKEFGNGKYPAIRPIFGDKLMINFPWHIIPFNLEPYYNEQAKKWETSTRIVNGNYPTEEGPVYFANIQHLWDRIVDLVVANALPKEDGGKAAWPAVNLEGVEERRDVIKKMALFFKKAKKEGFPAYQKLRIDTQRESKDRRTPADHTKCVGLSVFDGRSKVDGKYPKVDPTSIIGGMAYRGAWELRHLAIGDKLTPKCVLREARFDEADNVRQATGNAITECTQ